MGNIFAFFFLTIYMNPYLIAIIILVILFIFYCHVYVFLKTSNHYEILQINAPDPSSLEKLFMEKSPIVVTGLVDEWIGINNIDQKYLKIQPNPTKDKVVPKLLDQYTRNYHLPFRVSSWYNDSNYPKNTKLELKEVKTHRHLVTQLQGKVKYVLYHPGQKKYLYNGKVSFWKWNELPDQEKEKYKNFPKGQYIELYLSAGKILHLPKGWWYAVDIIEDSIQITIDSSSIFSIMVQ
jgi:hypothetical protein